MAIAQKSKLLSLGAALFLAACGSSTDSSSFKTIFGDDNRLPLATTQGLGSMLARMDSGCSAALVGKFLALTAAHCVYDAKTHSLKDSIRYLDVGYNTGKVAARSWISAAWLGTTSWEEERKSDWAILSLLEPLGAYVGWFGISSTDPSSRFPLEVSLAGYAQDREDAETPVVETSCSIQAKDAKGRLLHDCDVWTGLSGGPIFQDTTGGPQIVGIHVSELRKKSSEPGPLQLEEYSDTLGNVMVSNQEFLAALTMLKSSVDMGTAATPLDGVLRIVNHNSSSTARVVLAADAEEAIEKKSDPSPEETLPGPSDSSILANLIAINRDANSVHQNSLALLQARIIEQGAVYHSFERIILNSAHLATATFYLSNRQVVEGYSIASIRQAARGIESDKHEVVTHLQSNSISSQVLMKGLQNNSKIVIAATGRLAEFFVKDR